MAHFVFPAAKKNDSQIKRKKEKTNSKITPISDQANNNQNSEQINTKFEEKYADLQKICEEKHNRGKNNGSQGGRRSYSSRRSRDRRADAQREVRDAATTNPTSVKDNPFNKISIEAAAAATTKTDEGTVAEETEGEVSDAVAARLRNEKVNAVVESIMETVGAAVAGETEEMARVKHLTSQRLNSKRR